MLRRYLLTAVVLLAAPAAWSLAASSSVPDEQRPIHVEDPCELAGRSGSCLLGRLTGPPDRTVLTSPVQVLTFEGIAELNRTVLLYLANAETGEVLNNIPYRIPTDGYGKFQREIDVTFLGNGRFYAAAYFEASFGDPERDETFYQVTGVPVLEFSLDLPTVVVPPPPGSPPGVCTPETDNTCAFHGNFFEIDGMLFTKFNDGLQIFWVRPEDREGSLDIIPAQNISIQRSLDEVMKAVCSMASDEGKDIRVPAQVEEVIVPALASMQLDVERDRLTDISGEAFHTTTTYGPRWVADQVRGRLASQGGCTGSDLRPRDTSWSPTISGNDVTGWLFYTGVTGSAMLRYDCSYQCEPHRALWVSGTSPLLFLTSDEPLDARVDVSPRDGHVSYSRPRKPERGWEVSVGAVAEPLYYEFQAPLPLLPEQGWSVPGAEVESFLHRLLTAWGYEREEIEAFIAADVRPALPEAPFVEIRLFDRATVDALLPLNVSPTPNAVERVLFHLTPTATQQTLSAPAPIPHAFAPGFTVREIGALFADPT